MRETLMKIIEEQIVDMERTSEEILKCPLAEMFPMSFVTYEEIDGKVYRVKANIELNEM